MSRHEIGFQRITAAENANQFGDSVLVWTPETGREVSSAFSDHLQEPVINQPLIELLDEASFIDDLLGIGFAVWRNPITLPNLTTYPVLDIRNSSVREKFNELYYTFKREIRAKGTNPPSVSYTMMYCNAREDLYTIEDIASNFPNEDEEAFVVFNHPQDVASLHSLLLK